ncbi:hypothetical protein [Streptomyces sp. NPDC007346]|uniref:hypothetical protein n=1 Tax=Streptomyces sp. NPDC007346 TaxID=3154682 RepID=UPI003456D620
MTTQPRIPLDDLTSDALDALYEQLEAAESTELARQLDTCREAHASAIARVAQYADRAIENGKRAATAEARVRALGADLVTLQDAHGAVTGQCRAAEADAAQQRARAVLLDGLLAEAVDWIRDGDLRDRMVAVLNPPHPGGPGAPKPCCGVCLGHHPGCPTRAEQ